MKEDTLVAVARGPEAHLYARLSHTRQAYVALAQRTGTARARRLLRVRLRELRGELGRLGIKLRTV